MQSKRNKSKSDNKLVGARSRNFEQHDRLGVAGRSETKRRLSKQDEGELAKEKDELAGTKASWQRRRTSWREDKVEWTNGPA